MNKFNELYNKIIMETTENIEEPPLSDEEKAALKTILENLFDKISISTIISSANTAIRHMESIWRSTYLKDDKEIDQCKEAIDYLEKFIDNPTSNNAEQYNDIKQMFIDFCLENEEWADKVLGNKSWIMRGLAITKALEVKLGERFNFNGNNIH